MPEHIRIGAVTPRVQYVADGVETRFVFPFPIFHPEDLKVFVDNGPVAGNFAVEGAGRSEGGRIAFFEPPASGAVITLRRTLPLKRSTDFFQGGDLRADSFNDEFDRQTALAQQLDEMLARTVRAPAHDTPAFLELPDRAVRANQALVFDTDGNLTIAPLEPRPQPFLPPRPGAQPRDVYDKLTDVISAKDFGARGDGLADDTAALGAALAAGPAVYLPPGTYRVTGTLTIGHGRTLFGAGDGSVISTASTAIVLIELPESYASLHDVRLVGGAVGVRLYGRTAPCVQNTLYNLSIWQAGTGLLLDGYQDTNNPCYWNGFHDILIAQPSLHGVHLTRTGAGDTPNANRFSRVRVYSLSAPIAGSGFYVEQGKYNNSFLDCEANLSTDAQCCFRIGPNTEKTLIVNLYTETLGGVPNVWLEPGSTETAITNLLSASAGPAIWDQSGGRYTALNAGYPAKNFLGHSRITELVVERFRFDTEYLEPPAGGLLALDLTSSVYLISAFGGPVEARLPNAGAANGQQVTIKRTDAAAHALTVTEASGPGPDDRSLVLANRYDVVTLVSNGARWHVVGGNGMPDNAFYWATPGLYEPELGRRVHLVSAWSGAVEVRLPAPGEARAIGRQIIVKKTDPSANPVTVTQTGGGGPDNAAVTLAGQYGFVAVFSDGAAWHIVGRQV